MQLEDIIRDIVRDEFDELSGSRPVADPELITVAEFISQYPVSRDTAYGLVNGAPDNGFPSVRLGPKSVVIDKPRLNRWLATGGMGAKI